MHNRSDELKTLVACRYQQVDRKNYQLIEHLMRKAKKQLAMIQQSQVTGVKVL